MGPLEKRCRVRSDMMVQPSYRRDHPTGKLTCSLRRSLSACCRARRLYSRWVDDIVGANREKLAGLLQDREDWRYGPQDGTQDGEEYWCFGVAGALRLTITPEMDGFLMCVHDQGRGEGLRQSWIIPRIESVGEWLDEHEAEHAGLTSAQEEFKKAYEKAVEEKERGASGD
jgi:hypothetical protein